MNKQRKTGFSLSELLVVLAITSILATLAYPSYTTYLVRTRRAQAKTALLQLAGQLEYYAAIHHSYKGATLATLGSDPSLQNNYQLQITYLTTNDYRISAKPIRNQTQDTLCGTLSLTQNGTKSITGNGKLNDCWEA